MSSSARDHACAHKPTSQALVLQLSCLFAAVLYGARENSLSATFAISDISLPPEGDFFAFFSAFSPTDGALTCARSSGEANWKPAVRLFTFSHNACARIFPHTLHLDCSSTKKAVSPASIAQTLCKIDLFLPDQYSISMCDSVKCELH